MRLSILFLILGMTIATGTNLYSQTAILNLHLENATIEDVINDIEEQSEYRFLYNKKMVDVERKVSISAEKENISEILKDLLKDTDISYTISDRHIVLNKKGSFAPLLSPQQQGKTITGIIVDEKGETVIGANVMEKGTTNGVVTDADGQFTINVSPTAILAVSYIGYLTQEVSVRNQTTLSIVLLEDTKTLDEVVVVGYGTTSTRKMAAAVTAIKGEKLEGLPFPTVAESLQGRLAGVIVQKSGGEPGSNASLSIRGGSTPLYVIDGVVSTEWDFNVLNPNDIENMSVLKDAAALAVYGSRASNGIILVKTRQGGKGKTSVTYSFNAQYSQPTKLLDRVDSYTYAQTVNAAAVNDGYADYHVYDQATMEIIRNQSDPYRYANDDWMDLGLNNFAPEYRHSLSLNGSGKLANYYLSLGVLDQGSLYSSNALNYNRYTLRSNVNTTFEEIGLRIGFNINGAVDKKEYPAFSSGEIWGHMVYRSPLIPAYNADGTYSSATDHALVEMDKRSGYNRNNGSFVNFQFTADWNLPFAKEITIGTMANYRVNSSHEKIFTTKAPQFYADGSVYPIGKPTLTEKAYFGNSYNFEVNAAYVKTFNNAHTIDAKAVFTVSESEGFNFQAYRKDYISAAVDQLFAGSPEGMTNSGNSNEGGRMGVVGRLKYDYKNRYIIEGNFRYDGSDNFAPGYRWGFFPSGAVAWALSEEPFFKSLQWQNVDLIKVRASYGQTGTETGVNRFGYLSTYSMDENAIVIGGKLQSGFSEGDLVSPNLLSWYTQDALNYGVDFSLFNYRMKGDINYFYYVTKGGLMSPGDRYTTPLGKKLPQIKSDSEHRREGIDFNIQWQDKIGKDLTYEVGVNGTYYNNLWVTKADEAMTTLMNPWKRQTHQTDYYGLGLKDGGLYQTPEQVVNTPRRSQSSETRLGDIVYQDINGDGKIDGEDQVRIGMPTAPHFTYGINFGFGYKGFSLSGLFYGTGKRYMELGLQLKKGEGQSVINDIQLDYWREDNKDALFPRISTVGNVNGSHNQQGSTFWMRDASFFRLKNLQIDYDFKYKLLKNVNWMNSCRLTLAGTNLFTLSSIYKFIDPETASTDGSAYPVQRVFSVGLTVGF
ncbi:TonB-dependent receptor [Parabacteroides sp. OttesenSCG-928-K15]|nr:TonB-dependent receptor [Parabacteroides sp. OttesenSCG-928-K15]